MELIFDIQLKVIREWVGRKKNIVIIWHCGCS